MTLEQAKQAMASGALCREIRPKKLTLTGRRFVGPVVAIDRLHAGALWDIQLCNGWEPRWGVPEDFELVPVATVASVDSVAVPDGFLFAV